MTAADGLLLEPAATSRLRVGIKWDALERDEFKVSHKLQSDGQARKQLAKDSTADMLLGLLADFLWVTYIFRPQARKIQQTRQATQQARENLKGYLQDRHRISHDLDLWCAAFDGAGQLVLLHSPEKLQHGTAALTYGLNHSGDESTGLSTAFDEELLVTLRDVSPSITQLAFIVVSNGLGFNEVQSGAFGFMRTKDETMLLKGKLTSQSSEQICLLATLTRTGENWQLQVLNRYHALQPDTAVDVALTTLLQHKPH